LGYFLNVYLKGRSWGTNGPVLSFSGQGNKDPGHEYKLLGPNKKLRLNLGAKSPRQIDRLELVYNGEVVRSFPGSATSDVIIEKVDLPIPEGGWLAARVFEVPEQEGAPLRYAHSSPIYVKVRGHDDFQKENVQAFASQITEDYNRFARDETLPKREKDLLLEWYGFARDRFLEKLK
jgi:hypothetical protein